MSIGEKFAMPVILFIATIMYIVIYNKIKSIPRKNWLYIQFIFSVIIVIITIADSYGNGEYEVFPNVCILIMALFSATDLRNSYKEESKKSESDS